MASAEPPRDLKPVADPVIDLVKGHNAGFNNTRYTKTQVTYEGPGHIYQVDFLGENQNWYRNYVLETGDQRRVYDTIDKLLTRLSRSPWADPEYVKLMVISLITFLFAVAFIYLVAVQPENKSLQVLTGLLGLMLGYFVGKREK
jgi:hypothetical protein